MPKKSLANIKRRTPFPSFKIPVILLVAALCVGGSTYMLLHSRHKPSAQAAQTTRKNVSVAPPNTVDYSPPSNTDSQVSNQAKNDTDSSSGTSSAQTSPANFSVVITHVTNVQTNQAVSVGTQVEGVTNGTCTLTASQAGQQSVVQTNTVNANATSYACPTFNIPYPSFPTGGEWKFSVTLTNNGQSASNTWAQTVSVDK